MEPLSLYWAKTHTDLREMAIDLGLIKAKGAFVDTDELVRLLEEHDHRYDDYPIKKLKANAVFFGLEKDVNDKAELIAFIKEAEHPSILDEIKLMEKARRNKDQFDFCNRHPKKPKFYKEGCVKRSIDYSADAISWKQCEGKVQGRKCKNWDKVSVEVMISKDKYICKDCQKNKIKK